MADQAINALSTKTAPETSDQLLLVGAGEPQLIDYDKLADAILNKITSKNYALDAGTMTLPAALNALNGKSLKYKDVRYDVSLTFPSNGYIEFPTNSETKSIWELNNLSGLNIIGTGILNWNASIVYGVSASGTYVYGPSGKQTRNLIIRYYYT